MRFILNLSDYERHQASKRSVNASILFILLMLAAAVLFGCSKQTAELEPANTNASLASDSSKNVYISLDKEDNGEMPKRFRKSNDNVDNHIGDKTINLDGLTDLNISGSGQFTGKSLQLIKNEIDSKMSVIVIDLRQESHGFINDMAISWSDDDNKANKGLTMQQVIRDEEGKLEGLLSRGIAELKTDEGDAVKVDRAQNEEELVKGQNMTYLRLPVTNNEKPLDDIVDLFVNFVKSQPENTWVHFHCMEGVGRTTTFMVMYDSMKNAKRVSLDDIMDRQVLLGGKNLINTGRDAQSEAGKRAEFIKMFYKYCSENSDNYNTPWSEWIKLQ